MGRISESISDLSFVTSDNPRSEDPKAIIGDITSGMVHRDRYRVVPDRREAIGAALALAEAGDTVVIAGKGHEDYQIVGDARLAFDDRQIAREIAGAVQPAVEEVRQ